MFGARGMAKFRKHKKAKQGEPLRNHPTCCWDCWTPIDPAKQNALCESCRTNLHLGDQPPDPEEIAERAERIREEWTPLERYLRSEGRDMAALIEAIESGEVAEAEVPAAWMAPVAVGSEVR